MVYSIEIEGEEVVLEVEASVSKIIPAKLYGPPEDCYPAEGGEIEVQSVTCEDAPTVTTAQWLAVIEHVEGDFNSLDNAILDQCGGDDDRDYDDSREYDDSFNDDICDNYYDGN